MTAILQNLTRRLADFARALRATLADPGPRESDAFRREGAVFQRAPCRKAR